METLQYSSQPENRANRNYTVMLVVLAIFFCFSTLALICMIYMPLRPTDVVVKWVFGYSAALYVFLALLVLSTLFVRSRGLSNGCLIWTKAFNIFLLIIFPFGTAVGIYGLWKVDKRHEPLS